MSALAMVARVAKATNHVQRSIDRRIFRRFRFLVPVLFRWADSAEHYDVGNSGNVGMGGMFIFTSKYPPLGTQVELEFVIPAFDLVPHQVRFRCIGQVTRVETCYKVAGFAVAGRLEGGLEGGQLGYDIEEVAASLLTRQ